jgi:hypothetical protein
MKNIFNFIFPRKAKTVREITKDNFRIRKVSDVTGYERYYVETDFYSGGLKWESVVGNKFGFRTLKEAETLIKKDLKFHSNIIIKEGTRKIEIL